MKRLTEYIFSLDGEVETITATDLRMHVGECLDMAFLGKTFVVKRKQETLACLCPAPQTIEEELESLGFKVKKNAQIEVSSPSEAELEATLNGETFDSLLAERDALAAKLEQSKSASRDWRDKYMECVDILKPAWEALPDGTPAETLAAAILYLVEHTDALAAQIKRVQDAACTCGLLFQNHGSFVCPVMSDSRLGAESVAGAELGEGIIDKLLERFEGRFRGLWTSYTVESDGQMEQGWAVTFVLGDKMVETPYYKTSQEALQCAVGHVEEK